MNEAKLLAMMTTVSHHFGKGAARHKDTRATENVYQHVSQQRKRAAVERIGEALAT